VSAGLYAGWPDERAARLIAQIVRSLTTGEVPTPEDETGTGVAILRQGRATWNEVGLALMDVCDAAAWDPARMLVCHFLAVRARGPGEKAVAFETFPVTQGLAPTLAAVRGAMREPDGRTFAFANMTVWTGGYEGEDPGRRPWPTDDGDLLLALDMEAYHQAVRREAERARAWATV